MGTIRENPEERMLEELAHRQHLDVLELERAHIDKKNKYRNLSRCLNEIRRETNDDKKTVRANEPVLRKQDEVDELEKLSREVSVLRHDEVLEKKTRQHLRENSHELKELERKLRAAYVTKQQMAQIAEKQAMKQLEKLQERQAKELLTKVWTSDQEFRQETLQKEILHKAEYRRELQDQMIFREQTKRYEYEEFLKEKKALDDVIQRLNDEDVRAIEEKMCKMKKTQQEIDAFKTAQQFWREKQKKELQEEDRKMQEYLLSKASDAKAVRDEKARIEACKIKLTEDIAKKIYEVERQRREREDLLLQLREEEMKEEMELRNKRETDKIKTQKKETYTTLTGQMAENRERERKQMEEDARFKEQMIAKLAEDERLELLSNDKKRRKMLEVRKAVEQMIVERRQKKAEDMQRQARLLQMEKEEEEEKKRLIREERIKMIEEHAKNLIGFLPKGLLIPDDIPYINAKCGTTCPEPNEFAKNH